MDAETLLARGYLPKELPPPFSSQPFADSYAEIARKWTAISNQTKKLFKESTCAKYSIPRVNYSRRVISIPNPLHQQELVKCIVANWGDLIDFCKKSKLSASKPIEDPTGRRAIATARKFSEYKRAYVKDSFDRLYEIRTDIARFFPSIYTHSLSWALEGKQQAKKNRNNRSSLGSQLDIALRACQSSQTIGIPIGPDTSIILSELVGTAIDRMLSAKYKVNGYRFVDDYHIFCKTHEEAEHVLKYLQSCFAAFELDMNDSKTDILKFPQPFESRWTIELSTFSFSSNSKRQRLQIGQYFSLLYQNCKDYPDESVVKYGIKTLNRLKCQKENWSFLESLLLKTILAFPQALPEAFVCLRKYRSRVNKTNLRRAMLELLLNHCDKGHSFELAWAFWIAKFFQIRIPAKVVVPSLESLDVIPTIMAFDLYRHGLVTGGLNIRRISAKLTSETLSDEYWMLTYELLRKGWVRKKDNPLKRHEYFRILDELKIDFYDSSMRLITPPTGSKKSLLVWNLPEEPY